MNKIQYIILLEQRGITELLGSSIASAVRESGGDPGIEEMLKVNELAMVHYINKFQEQKDINEKLNKKIIGLENSIIVLEDDVDWLHWLEAAGVDNWDGFEYAQEMKEEHEANE